MKCTLDYIYLWGLSEVPSPAGSKFILTFIDDYLRKVWIFIMKHKYEVFVKFKQ